MSTNFILFFSTIWSRGTPPVFQKQKIGEMCYYYLDHRRTGLAKHAKNSTLPPCLRSWSWRVPSLTWLIFDGFFFFARGPYLYGTGSPQIGAWRGVARYTPRPQTRSAEVFGLLGRASSHRNRYRGCPFPPARQPLARRTTASSTLERGATFVRRRRLEGRPTLTSWFVAVNTYSWCG